jgi:hypothetical protein
VFRYYQTFLPHRPVGVFRIHANAPQVISNLDSVAVQLKGVSIQGFCALGNATGHMGLTSGRHPIAKKHLRHKLAHFGYYKHVSTPGLRYHQTRLISITLVVDNFGVKYINKEDIHHLIASIKKTNTLTKDWMGNLYCGIPLDWDYKNCTVNISMLGYVKKKLQEYAHIANKCIQTCPYMPATKQFGSEVQAPPPQIHPQSWIKQVSKRFKTLSVVSCIVQGPSTRLSSWP